MRRHLGHHGGPVEREMRCVLVRGGSCGVAGWRGGQGRSGGLGAPDTDWGGTPEPHGGRADWQIPRHTMRISDCRNGGCMA